jgi:hypothetical protein
MHRKILAGLSLFALLVPPPAAQNGPVTSNLKRALVYFYGYAGGDHQNTPIYAAYLQSIGAKLGVVVDTTRSQSVFTAANLANYQVLILFSAYNFGTNMTASQKAAVESWYRGNRGIGCFHQCVKNLWGGNYPNWYDSLMGTQYQTWAGFGSGPVTLNAAVEGTDLAMGMDAAGSLSELKAGHSQTWDDEWYTYTAMPGPNSLGGKTLMQWTTNRASFPGFDDKFTVPGEVQPMAWARLVGGGRFVLNSHFHRDIPRTSTNPGLRQFIDGAFAGSMKWLAGYTGCTDPASANYNPRATHNDPAVCKPSGTIRVTGGSRAMAPGQTGRMRVTFTGAGGHSLEVFDSRGRKVYDKSGQGSREYGFEHLRPGLYHLKASSGKEAFQRSFVLL